LDHYSRAGISCCWIIDADSQAGYECHREGPHLRQVDILTAGPVIEVPVSEISEEAAKF